MSAKSQAQFNSEVFRSAGLSFWRKIYLRIAQGMEFNSAIEFGAGDPVLLKELNCARKIAVDGTSLYKNNFTSQGIEFIELDLNQEGSAGVDNIDLAICSDVFEHLIHPALALKTIKKTLAADGALIAHVPNEYIFRKTIAVMLGRSESIYSHPHCQEWDHPHLHRFSDIGFRKFLETEFKYLVRITPIADTRPVHLLRSVGLPIPYCLERGPTYLCTNDPQKAQKTADFIAKLRPLFT
jgi:SAM-dependent methyltransferase